MSARSLTSGRDIDFSGHVAITLSTAGNGRMEGTSEAYPLSALGSKIHAILSLVDGMSKQEVSGVWPGTNSLLAAC